MTTSWLLIAVSGMLSALLVWGLVAPRSQWRVLVGWSTADPDAAEPGNGVHGIRRTICAIGLVGVLAVVGVQGWQHFAARPHVAADASALAQMWGKPTPRLIDRIVTPFTSAPDRLVPGAVVGIEKLTRGTPPGYLANLPRWDELGNSQPVGLVGAAPTSGLSGYGSSDALLSVRGPLNCIPRAAVVTATESAVKIGVYWGLPGSSRQDSTAACDMDDPVLQTVLLPIRLSVSLTTQALLTEAGAPIPLVTIPSD